MGILCVFFYLQKGQTGIIEIVAKKLSVQRGGSVNADSNEITTQWTGVDNQ